MVTKRKVTVKPKVTVTADPTLTFPKGYAGPTSGVAAPGAIGKAARAAAQKRYSGA